MPACPVRCMDALIEKHGLPHAHKMAKGLYNDAAAAPVLLLMYECSNARLRSHEG